MPFRYRMVVYMTALRQLALWLHPVLSQVALLLRLAPAITHAYHHAALQQTQREEVVKPRVVKYHFKLYFNQSEQRSRILIMF